MATPQADREANAASTKVHDHDLLDSTKEASESAEQTSAAALTDEELVLEKKLRLRIDLVIMPLIVWTYLLNYIDRYASMTFSLRCVPHVLILVQGITMQRPVFRVWKGISTSLIPSVRSRLAPWSSYLKWGSTRC